ncbi:MAG: glycoside hydrolase family 97 protein [Bacteroides sp.]|nr:glycoside hydrolase family 97 protein [Roseburia sp.]MCM1347121.1 glycoside hydrolase family 97 protein [Bacteroides sp.]MCM1421590.1 glycoside hydrolase family 97 protein [Bacteroides sp.]
MQKLCVVLLSVFSTMQVYAGNEKDLFLSSPDGNHTVRFSQVRTSEGTNEVRYAVRFKDKEVVGWSRAGLDMDNRVWEKALGVRDLVQPECWMDNLTVDSVSYGTHDGCWQPLYGERSSVRDHYHEGVLYLSKKDGSGYRMNIEVRAYDEGIAFRYFFPEHPKAIFHKVVADLTEYAFPEGTKAWCEEWAQAVFERKDVSEINLPVERALTLELPNGVWTAVTDADVDDWCLTRFRSSKTRRGTLESVMYSPVDIVTYYATPWKVVMSADVPGQLLEHNDIILNLNPPCEIPDVESWVKPGKIMRAGISTESGMEVIDFCAEHNIPYMLFDWQWYMPCTSHDGDATKVVDKVDMPKVIAYGKERGVGVWLYVNQHALMKQARTLFPVLREWGVVGVKSGFVQYASHRWATWIHDLVRLAADNHLMMNIHDEFRPSGFSRTYPNLLTQEGICGNEEWPDATHNVTLPFTRMINGAADYTICYYDKRLKNTHAHQLAASLVFYSPLLTVLWYDTPERFGGEREIEWFENLPTVFDETRVLDGYPGSHITMMRRSGEEYYLGLMTNNEPSLREVSLDFLDARRNYLAQIYTDGGEEVKSATGVKCTYLQVSSRQTLKFALKGRGGAAVRIIPLNNKNNKNIKRYNGKRI